jgi:recombination protein RecT
MNQQLTIIDEFKQQIGSPAVQENLREFIPDAQLAKFTAVTVRAVQENPDLLEADRKSMFLACQRAAQDGLMPDNREGALVIYNTKVGKEWIKKVQWQPMIGGIRKVLAKAGWDMRAEVVYSNDDFSYELGDKPNIAHKPAVFGDRGTVVGAYAIATEIATGAVYRETMDIDELEKVRAASKQSDGSVWTIWRNEMYRKTVSKRLRKYLPISDDTILDLIDRDNEQFDSKPAVSSAARNVQETIRAGNVSEPIEGEVVKAKPKPKKKKAAKKVAHSEPEPEPAPDNRGEEEPPPIEDPLDF